MKLLTLAIPTFERPEHLRETLKALFPQFASHADEAELLVLDNASTVAVQSIVEELGTTHPSVRYRVVRNTVNIGAHANMMRCLELAETPWIWLYGDDDTPAPEAITNVLEEAKRSPNAVYLNFSSPCYERPTRFETIGVEALTERIDSFSNFLFMSAGVFRREAILPHLRFGYLYSYSWAPNVSLLLLAASTDGKVIFSNKPTVDLHMREDMSGYWSVVNVMMGLPAILDLPMPWKARENLATILRGQHHLELMTYNLVIEALREGDSKQALYTFDHIVSRTYYFPGGLTTRLKLVIYRWLVRYPKFGEKIIVALYQKIKKDKELNASQVPSRWGRV